MDEREGSPPGISIKSLSYIKMFSDSALERDFFGLFSADAGHHSLDPVELGAIGKVCMVGNNKCEGEEGSNGRWLLCPSQYKVEDGK